ncbi:hypothetical protein Tcan_01693, partial [Toxocara canis]
MKIQRYSHNSNSSGKQTRSAKYMQTMNSFLAIHVHGCQFLEAGDGYVCDQRVQLIWRVFIIIASTRQTNTHTIGHIKQCRKTIPDSFRPQELIQSRIHTNVFRSHLLFGEFTHFIDCAWCSIFEAATTNNNEHSKDAFVQIDSIFSSNNLTHCTS